MRKLIAILSLAGILGSSASADSLGFFKTAFDGIAQDIAIDMAAESSFGNNWSDAYVGGFPHFGIGFTGGAVFTGSNSISTFTDLGIDLPPELSTLGFPMPAFAASFKIGLPWLPIDIGVKAMYAPPSLMEDLLAGTGVGVDLLNIGVQARYALVKQTTLLPNISVGVGYTYQKGGISAVLDDSSTRYFIDSANTYYVEASAPGLDISWASNTFDINAQISKKFLFIIPYVGVGATLGATSLTGGISSNLSTNYPGGFDALRTYMESLGQTAPDFSATGLSYTVNVNDPIFRVYGGFSLRLFVVDFDFQGIYLPFNEGKLGFALTTRLQF